ncbi:auxin response factor 3 isoform X2 [Nymphaea colorata]|uniref:auxin response factor 3 isoform X2 n=1 Tax=Nymphaea colorata TaxID=210225 RepID=UPI00129E9046|nr:auxin response factor 3 isoform X2 [Nymphaea colorata]
MEIDLNRVEEGCVENGGGDFLGLARTPPPCSSSLSSSSSSSVCLELWHACAGPLISLPRKGSLVVYFPQGHLEQQAQEFHSRTCDLPPQMFCRVMDVNLHAEKLNDEVYAQVSLSAEDESAVRSLNGEEEDNEESEGLRRRTTPHMFCKTLTASDTSTHGGFSVPRRAAEDCFPPLDYSQQRPSQELIAKDLHGIMWRFRHIYRGQPRRHLLTTGWSSFVNKKKLKSGDAVLFLRGDDGELRLGIRRAARPRYSVPHSAASSQLSNASMLSMVAEALSTKSVFHICYNPRASPAEFMIPYWKYLRSCNHPYSIGMRLKMRVETEDAVERRYTGQISGIGDVDPIRWPGSKWRCLVVRWDDDSGTGLHDRVSPWEIEPSSLVPGFSLPLTAASKRPKMSLPSISLEFPLPDRSGFSDFNESSRFQKVLQGQEISGFGAKYGNIRSMNDQTSGNQRYNSLAYTSTLSGMVGPMRTPSGASGGHGKCIGFEESNRFLKVLQGQEKFQAESPQIDGLPSKQFGFGFSEGLQIPNVSKRSAPESQGHSTQLPPKNAKVSSPSSVFMFQQASNRSLCPHSSNGLEIMHKIREQSSLHGGFDYSEVSIGQRSSPIYGLSSIQQLGLGNMCSLGSLRLHNQAGDRNAPGLTYENECQSVDIYRKSSCRLFGFSLKPVESASVVEDPVLRSVLSPADVSRASEAAYQNFPFTAGSERSEKHVLPNLQRCLKSSGRSCTKVHKQGSLVGRAIDLSKLNGYDDLIYELERLFDMEGLLRDPAKGWQVVYTDDENDMMLVGDDPWQEFCNIVSKIHIYTQEEVLTMASRMKSYEATSCSDAPVTIDVSKTSSEHMDSSVTVTRT